MDAGAGASGLIGDPDESRQASALFDYHERSKHRLQRYAPGPGGLDWANQPDPFRQFAGAETIKLPFGADRLATRYNAIRRGELPAAHAFDLIGVAILFEISLGLSAWKAFGSARWALRCNPSSGNLHPTEGYLLCPSLSGLAAGVYHYLSRDHALERRAAIDDPRWTAAFGTTGVVVGITSIYWREAWKYGMRAWRYCQHDCGHAIAALSYAAAALGWQTRVLSFASDETVAAVLGIDRDADFGLAEQEAADTLLWIGVGTALPDIERIRDALRDATWSGRANRLSAEHVDWPDIDSIHRATHKSITVDPDARIAERLPPPADPALDLPFAMLARRRRSAVDFDGETQISEECFYAMLDTLLPRENRPPWNALDSSPSVHAALLVHRVTGLEAGLYMLLRDRSVLSDLRQTLRLEWLWEKRGPAHLPLYLLLPYELREIAKLICCHQDIAADSCFALGMLAPVERVADAPWRYRRQFWECGMLGHALYLEAEAAGVRSTGIGCFFDDEMHELLGIADLRWQSLYHFTTGGPIDDPRLSTLPPYQFQP
ncbi:MAG: SagB/ThcOx family dehydrogenase [Betaproteobacteria bacterium]|nr:MAG: SagB/ThcOx family dehydrogenase [Betaproteobacteria bacterium]